MAKDGDDADDASEEGGGGGKSSILMFGGILLIAIGASIGGTVFFMQGDEPPSEEAVVEDVPPSMTAVYHNIRPAFHVNFMVGNKSRVLQTEITIMARDVTVIESVVNHAPMIRHSMIDLLSDQDYIKLQTHDGKMALREDARLMIDTLLERESGVKGVDSVLFTSFVMQ